MSSEASPIHEVLRCDAPSRPLSLTAILVIVGDYASGAKSLRCLAEQTAAAEMELILASDQRATLEAAAAQTSHFGATQLVLGDVQRLPHLRAACAQRARTPVVAFNEDHAFVDANWAETIVRVFAEDDGIVAVAASMVNPNPRHPVSRAQFAAFFAQYERARWSVGEFDLATLPWHNTIYRRDALVNTERLLGSATGHDLEVEGTLQAHLRQAMPGCRFVLTSRTATHHVNVSRLGPALRHGLIGGRLFASNRATVNEWSRARRVLQACGAPLVPFVRLVRDRHLLIQCSRGSIDLLWLLMHALVMAMGHAAGEVVGLLFGHTLEHVRRYADFECRRSRFVHADDRALLTA